MSKAYVVTSGWYSDYGIEKVFLDKFKADRYCEIRRGSGDDYRVEEFNLSDEDLMVEVEVIRLDFSFKDLQILNEEKYVEIYSEFYPYTSLTYNYSYNYYADIIPKGIILERTIKTNETYEEAKERLFKIAQDIKTRVEYEIENGATKSDIEYLINTEYYKIDLN